MKHYSIRARRKKRKAAQNASHSAETTYQAPPPPETLANGLYAAPQGQGKRHKPFINQAPDLIGLLFLRGKIKPDEEQAARHFQAVREAYKMELELKGYRSCLNTDQGGYDDSDGNPAVVAAYDDLRQLLGPRHCAFVARETEKQAHEKPDDLRRLRVLLQKVAGA